MKRKKTTHFGINTSDPRVAASLRIAGYSLMLIAATLIAWILVATARGYDINRETGEVIQNGLVLVDADPGSANIFVDGQDEQDTTPGRLPLPFGSYDISLREEGYIPWQKTVAIEGSEVEWLYYPRLFPEKIERTLIDNFENVTDVRQSPDRRWVLVQEEEDLGQFILIDLENVLDEPEIIQIPAIEIQEVAANQVQRF